ncbi:hypothetical protein PIB30_097013, partial [Stylosanthes scabra]|nr:hypothetical protein [Stylosanthes scabra]
MHAKNNSGVKLHVTHGGRGRGTRGVANVTRVSKRDGKELMKEGLVEGKKLKKKGWWDGLDRVGAMPNVGGGFNRVGVVIRRWDLLRER